MRPLEVVVSDLIAEAQHGADSLDFREVMKYQAVVEAARALADKNLDNVNRTTLHQAVHDHETVRALHDLVYAVEALDALEEKS